MNPTLFISNQIDNIVSLFPYLKVRYEYEFMSNCHYLEILPFEKFQKDKDYIAFERSFRTNFISAYPLESLCFLSENSLCEIEKPVIEKAGILYGINYQGLIDNQPNLITYSPVIDQYKSFTLPKRDSYGINFVETVSMNTPNNNPSITFGNNNYIGESSYAMAA